MGWVFRWVALVFSGLCILMHKLKNHWLLCWAFFFWVASWALHLANWKKNVLCFLRDKLIKLHKSGPNESKAVWHIRRLHCKKNLISSGSKSWFWSWFNRTTLNFMVAFYWQRYKFLKYFKYDHINFTIFCNRRMIILSESIRSIKWGS